MVTINKDKVVATICLNDNNQVIKVIESPVEQASLNNGHTTIPITYEFAEQLALLVHRISRDAMAGYWDNNESKKTSVGS